MDQKGIMKLFFAILLFWWLFFTFLFSVAVHADVGGMDFTMLEDKAMTVPWFNSIQEAADFGLKYKWTQPVLDVMHKRLSELNEEAYDKDHGWVDEETKGKPNRYKDQRDWVFTCVSIMEDFKSKGIKGDPSQVGAEVRMSNTPLLTQDDYVSWR